MSNETKGGIRIVGFCAGIFLFFVTAAPARAIVVINEIGAFEATGNEWVELYNPDDTPVDITGWKFWENNTNHSLAAPTDGSMIVSSHEYVLIVQDPDKFLASHAGNTARLFDSSWGTLNESGEEIGLKDASGNEIEKFTYIATSKFSLERKNALLNDYASANWVEHGSGHTAGKPNDAANATVVPPADPPPVVVPPAATSTPVAIKINEFLSNPNTGEKEWIELLNTSNQDADLTGWSIEDGTSKAIASPTGTIVASGFFVIELSSAKLNNGGDTIRLKNATGEAVDVVIYGTASGNATVPAVGNSVARSVDGGDTDTDATDFAETATPTRGAANSITNTQATPAPTPVPRAASPQVQTTTGSSVRVNAPRDIVINEVTSDPGDGMDEFVELYNTTGETITLDGWHIEDGSETETVLSGSIGSKRFFLIERPKGSLNNAGDAVTLIDPSGKTIDHVTYGTWDDGNVSDNAPGAGDPYTLVRRVDGQDSDNDAYDWVLSTTPTPGKANVVVVPLGSISANTVLSGTKNVVINEVYPNPPGSDAEDEFIELKNVGKEAVDVTGWKIGDASAARYAITQGALNPGGILFFKRKMTNISLNNSGVEEVKLFSPAGTLIDQMKYSGSAREGEAYARTDGGAWQWTTKITPGVENIFAGIKELPILSIDVNPDVRVGEVVTFDASDSTAVDGGPLQFFWNFGDGATSVGEMGKHVYPFPGTFHVTLTASDRAFVTSTREVVVTVKNIGASGTGPLGDIHDVVISEILPNPAGADTAEFIELYNPTDTPIDLSGVKVDDEDGGSKAFAISDGVLLSAHEYKVLTRKETGLALNNTSDEARLIVDGKVVVSVAYDTTKEGASYARTVDGEYRWTSVPTPGKENVFAVTSSKIASGRTTSAKTKALVATTLDKVHTFDTGDRVQVSGTVTVLPGVFGSQYFYINDEAGNGVQVYMNKKQFPTLHIGDRVQVTGELGEIGGEQRIKVQEQSGIVRVSGGQNISPQTIEVASVGEQNVGSLVQIAGEMTEKKASYFFLDDGDDEAKVYVKKGAGIDMKKTQLGDRLEVTGIISQTKSGPQILPRSQSDIQYLGHDEMIVVPAAPASVPAAENFLTTTAGGLTAIFLSVVARTRAGIARALVGRAAAFASGIVKRKVG